MALVGTGSKYENKQINGVSHFLEHMFFKGTKKRSDKMKIAEDLDRVGGNYNAFTGFDYTGYWAKVASDKFSLAMDWVSDIYLNSLLPADEIERERGVIIEEINMCYDHPMRYIWNLWHELLYGDQPAGWDIAGTKETVSAITRGQMIAYRKNNMWPQIPSLLWPVMYLLHLQRRWSNAVLPVLLIPCRTKKRQWLNRKPPPVFNATPKNRPNPHCAGCAWLQSISSQRYRA